MGTKNDNAQRGGALIYVLWIAMILSTLLIGMIATSRFALHTARSQMERFKLSAAMHAASEITAYRASTEAGFIHDIDQSIELNLNGYTFLIESYAPYSPLNINAASEQELSGFFVLLGQDVEEANLLAAQITDWRDSDNLVRANGAERLDYDGAGISKRIENRPFLSVDELRLVKDMPSEFFECIRPAVSVISSSTFPGRKLLHSLYGLDGNYASQVSYSQIGTSNNVPKGGTIMGFRISGNKRGKSHPISQRVSIYRFIGKTTSPYELIATFVENEIKPAQPSCIENF